jgi:hypothetical protein
MSRSDSILSGASGFHIVYKSALRDNRVYYLSSVKMWAGRLLCVAVAMLLRLTHVSPCIGYNVQKILSRDLELL